MNTYWTVHYANWTSEHHKPHDGFLNVSCLQHHHLFESGKMSTVNEPPVSVFISEFGYTVKPFKPSI